MLGFHDVQTDAYMQKKSRPHDKGGEGV